MKFVICGLNHKTAPVEVRERLAFNEQSLPVALENLKSMPGVQEALVLSTCNRVEVIVAAEEQTDAYMTVLRFLKESRNADLNSIEEHSYQFEGKEAIQHLFRVASSLDSMIVGEPQILGQLKSAFARAKAQGALGAYLETILTQAFRAAKHVRTETGIGESAVSVGYAAVELAREIFGSLNDRKIMVVGAGKMSELAVRHLRRSGKAQIFVTNRTYERAVDLAKLFDGTLVEYDRFLAVLPEMDIVITSSGAPHYILHKKQMRQVIEARKNRPMFLIDIAVPRNVEPSVNEIDNVFLYDIDDLQRVVDSNRHERMKRAELAEEIISGEVEQTVSRLNAREVAPTIVSLQEQLEQVRSSEIERVRAKLGPLTPQQEEAVDGLTRGIINKIAHAPILELRRQAGHSDAGQITDIIRRLFNLGN